jgi:hypothetical protein
MGCFSGDLSLLYSFRLGYGSVCFAGGTCPGVVDRSGDGKLALTSEKLLLTSWNKSASLRHPRSDKAYLLRSLRKGAQL